MTNVELRRSLTKSNSVRLQNKLKASTNKNTSRMITEILTRRGVKLTATKTK